jgi:O-antigen/teichoic acid export membrane protein
MGLNYLLLRLHDRRGTPLGFSRQSFHQLTRVGLSPAAGYLLTIAAPKLFVIAIATTFGSAAAGFANLAFRAIDAARDVISAAVGQLLLPLVSKAERETGKGGEISLTGTSLVCATTFPVFWGGAICAPEVVTLFFGPEWQQAVPLFAAHSLTMSYTFAVIVIATRMTAIGRPNGMLPGLAAQSLVVIGGAFLAGAASLGSSAVLIAAIWTSRLLVALPLDLFFIHREFSEQFTSFLHRLARYSAHSLAMVAVVATVDAFAGPYVSLPERLTLKVMTGAVVIAALYLLLERPILREVQQLLALGLSRKEQTEA